MGEGSVASEKWREEDRMETRDLPPPSNFALLYVSSSLVSGCSTSSSSDLSEKEMVKQ